MGMILDGDFFKNPDLKLVGQSLVVFFSILGGAIVSSAWTELRTKYKP
jgi:hypothetical protein